MWVFCKQGFFSAVEHRDNSKLVLIRSRFKGDLEKLVELIQNELKINIKGGVEHTPNADYSYRMLLRKADWAKVVEKIANDVDYDNFKDSVHEGYDSLRDNAYMGCWRELRKTQERQQETQK